MKPRTTTLRTDINITPLIDIVLVLLIVFIVMVPTFAHAQRAQVAGGGSLGPVLDLPRITVLGGSRYLWGKEALGEEALMARMVASLATQAPAERKVVLQIPPEMQLSTVSEAMDLLHRAAALLGDAKAVRAVLIEAKAP